MDGKWAGELACLTSSVGFPRPYLVMWHAAAIQLAFRGTREQDAAGTVKEREHLCRQTGTPLLILASDSLHLAGSTMSHCPHFWAAPGISGWAHFASPSLLPTSV